MRHSPLALALALAALLAAVPSASAGSADRCAQRGSGTVVLTKAVRVYSVDVRDDHAGEQARLYACLRATGRRVFVASRFDDEFVSSGSWRKVVVADGYVASTYRSQDISCKADCPPDYQPVRVQVIAVRLTTRRGRVLDAAGGTAIDAQSLRASGATVSWVKDGRRRSKSLS